MVGQGVSGRSSIATEVPLSTSCTCLDGNSSSASLKTDAQGVIGPAVVTSHNTVLKFAQPAVGAVSVSSGSSVADESATSVHLPQRQ